MAHKNNPPCLNFSFWDESRVDVSIFWLCSMKYFCPQFYPVKAFSAVVRDISVDYGTWLKCEFVFCIVGKQKIIKQQRMLFVIKLLTHITSFTFALTYSLLFTTHASWTFFLFVFYLSYLFPLLYVWACMLMCEKCVISHTLLQMRWYFKGTEGFSLTTWTPAAKLIVYSPKI